MNTPQPAQSADELFDVVDGDDRVIGQATRGRVHAEGLLHRAVHCWVVRPSGALVLQMRSPGKDQYPSTWTSSASGHVDAGETYRVAIGREVAEELGLSDESLSLLAKVAACEELSREHTELYICRTDAALTPDPSEIAYLEERPVREWIAELERSPGDFSPSIRYLLTRFADQLED